jgi:hypothetical protein
MKTIGPPRGAMFSTTAQQRTTVARTEHIGTTQSDRSDADWQRRYMARSGRRREQREEPNTHRHRICRARAFDAITVSGGSTKTRRSICYTTQTSQSLLGTVRSLHLLPIMIPSYLSSARGETDMARLFKSLIGAMATCSCLILLDASASVASADVSGGGSRSTSIPAQPKNGDGSAVTAKSTRSITLGWNYFICHNIWSYKSGKNTVVEITNDDGSYFNRSVRSANPDTAQQMMLRACRAQGAEYGVRITNTTTFAWDAIVGY